MSMVRILVMKQNGNDVRQGNYYLGLDVGSASVGWAVTDQTYNLLKCNGKQMWGARLFDEAKTAADRRANRTMRRRLDRRQQRLNLLEILFNDAIVQEDASFFIRMHDSNLVLGAKHDTTCSYSLFNDPDFTDKDYLKRYPTVYHLRSELIHSDRPHDVRLVFLAIHHILKSRGHFLYENVDDADAGTLDGALQQLENYLLENNITFYISDKAAFSNALISNDGITKKKKELKHAYGDATADADTVIDINTLLELLTGASVQLSKLFKNDDLKDTEIKKISLKNDLDNTWDQLNSILGDQIDLIAYAKGVYDTARLSQMLGADQFISDAKIRLYNKNKKDLQILKNYVKKHHPNEYKIIFDEQLKLNNFAAYSRYKTENRCTQEEFCKFLKSRLPDMASSSDPEEVRIFKEIDNKTFFTKLKGSDNGSIPNQLHLKELKEILANASKYLTFLNVKDADGLSVSDKIISLFTFRIPYYVGPLNQSSSHAWLSRTSEKIYPWNFDKVVDRHKSAQKFMSNLTARCTYTGDIVLPLNSLLYSEFMVLNVINKLKINGKPIDVNVKKSLYHDLFEKQSKKVTLKAIRNYMLSNGFMEQSDEVSGVDETVQAALKSYHDFKDILERIHDIDQIEKIIEAILVYSSDKKMLKEWLEHNTHDLSSSDISKILRLNYKDWGRLSRHFLTGIFHIDKNGVAFSIMDMLRNTNKNLSELLSDQYQFAENAEKYREEHYPQSISIHDQLDEMYISPAARRSIWQTLRVVDEIVDIEKAAPKKIFIEMARPNSRKVQKARTISRKKTLLELYESCKDQEKELYAKLENETDQSLRRDKLYLYYLQMGKCMYSGEPINDLDACLNGADTYDIDHIYPRSKIKDDSLNNRVLVKSSLNRDKTNTYPISDAIRKKMHNTWSMLHQKGFISDEKYYRLTRATPLTDEELSAFVSRQLIETQQSTKALASILRKVYPTAQIVYSKAGNVTDFRHQFDIPKFRDINDLHHAKDAYLNIVVGNVYDTRFTKRFFINIQNETYSLNRVFEFDTKSAWLAPAKEEMILFNKSLVRDGKHASNHLLSGTIQTVYKYIYKNNPIVTFAPVEKRGKLFDLQILPKGKGQHPIKRNMPINKYGGYNNMTGAYSCVVSHTENQNEVITVAPVYLYAVKDYEKDPVKYCEEVLKYNDPVIIVKKVLFNSILEFDGIRLGITGRSDVRNTYINIYQLAISDDKALYLKACQKYMDRCAIAKKVITPNGYDQIDKEKNLELYDWFIEKCDVKQYETITKTLKTYLLDCRNKFIELDDCKQCKILIEILKTFTCNADLTSLKELNGKEKMGAIRKSSNMSKSHNVYLVNQSVTGLFETKVDLLHSNRK